jgi:Uma2 family endonuclease
MDAPAPNLSPLVRTYSLEELWELEPPPEGGRWELIGGVLFMSPQPKLPHEVVVSNLIRLLSRHQDLPTSSCRLFAGTTPIWTRPHTWLVPDLFLISRERFATVDEGVTSAELVVEVQSPSTANYDRTTKADTYAALGVRELWLVDHVARTIERRVLRDDRLVAVAHVGVGDTLASTAFPGLTIPVADVFATD